MNGVKTFVLPTNLKKGVSVDNVIEDQWAIYEGLYTNRNDKSWLVNNDHAHEIYREIKKKWSGYKSQDKTKHKFDAEQHISLDALFDKLYESKLKCYYCQQETLILFNKKKDGTQWSLERLNNNLGHYGSNTCISCLQCNLKRRTDNHEYYKLGKTMTVTKKE
jgi:hypothetical protein